MKQKIDPLKNILQKFKNFYIFLNFVLKKIVSLHLVEKSSVKHYILLYGNVRSFKQVARKNKFRRNADLLVCNSGNSHNLIKRIV